MFVGDDFRALQAVNLIAGMLLFPAIYFLCREAGLRFETSLVAAALCPFFPSVWVYGGSAFSDVPSLTLVTFAVALLLRGARDRKAYFLGALLLAFAIGIRPQNVLIGLFPAINASRRRRPRDIAITAGIAIAAIAILYGSAIEATGIQRFVNAVSRHSQYIAHNDSFVSPSRPPLSTIFERLFLRQYSAPALNVVMSLCVLIAIVFAIRERSRPIARIAMTFAPFVIFALLMLDHLSTRRYSIGYAPMFAILAADGVSRIGRRYALLLGGALAIGFIVWTWPALTIVRTTIAPPILGVEAAVRLKAQPLYVAIAMTRFVDYLAPSMRYVPVLDENATPDGWLLTEIDHTQPRGEVFRRDPGRLWNIVRHRYFTVALEPPHLHTQ